MTSVSSLGSALTQYQSPISSLDKNGDGVVSADELAAANQPTGTSTTSSADGSGDNTASIVQKVRGDILSLMLQVQQQSDGNDGSSADSKGLFASMDTNGDGKLTTTELLSAQPDAAASGDANGESDPFFANVANDMQTALQAYRNTYGAAEAADGAAQTTQAL